MIVSIFLYSCFTRSLSDINERKFVHGTKHFSNQWEYGGYTSYDETKNRFELVPGDRYSEGFVWFSNRLPRNNWSIRPVFEFFLDSQLNQFGVWITSRFGPTGEIFGGPPSFTGVAILLKFSLGKLSIEIRQSNGNLTYRPIVFYPQFSTELTRPKISLNISFTSNETLNIRLKLYKNKTIKSDTHQNKIEKNDTNFEYSGFNINIDDDNQTTNKFLLFHDKPIVSLSHFWLGVTSYNPKDGKPLFLNSIHLKGQKSKFTNSINTVNSAKIQKTIFLLLNSSKIKNQKLIQFLNETDQNESLQNFENFFDYEDVIEYIEALVNVSNKMLRSKLLTHVTRTQMIPFTEAWQRRSLSITSNAKFLRETIQNEMGLIEQEITFLSKSVWKTFKQFKRELIELTDELIDSYERRSFIKSGKANEIEGNNLNTLLLYIGLFEIIILMIAGPYLLIFGAKIK